MGQFTNKKLGSYNNNMNSNCMIERVPKVKSDLYQKWYFNGCGQLVKKCMLQWWYHKKTYNEWMYNICIIYNERGKTGKEFEDL